MYVPSQEPLDSRRGWLVAFASSLMMGVAFGTILCVTVFFPPLEAEFGWSRDLTSFAYTSSAFLNGLFGLFIGRLVDRMSVRPIVFVGAIMVGLAQVLLSQIDALWQLYLIYGVMVGGLGGGSFLVPLTANIAFWFNRHKGLAMAAVLAGQSLGGAVMPLLARGLLSVMDWRDAYLVLGLVGWAVLVPLAMLIREPPGRAATRSTVPSGEGRSEGAGKVHTQGRQTQAELSPKALLRVLSLAIVACCICMAIPMIHVYPLALNRGIAPTEAALVLSSMMGFSIIGRLAIGKIADRIGGIGALLLASGGQTVVIFWFSQAETLSGFLLVAAMFALGYGGVVPSYAIIVRELMPANKVGVAMGTIFFFGNLGMALGGYLGGLFYEWSGRYSVSYGMGAVAGVINLLIVGTLLLLQVRSARRMAEAA